MTNHSGRKTLKKYQVPKSEKIDITGHSPQSGLDAYDSGNEVQQK